MESTLFTELNVTESASVSGGYFFGGYDASQSAFAGGTSNRGNAVLNRTDVTQVALTSGRSGDGDVANKTVQVASVTTNTLNTQNTALNIR